MNETLIEIFQRRLKNLPAGCPFLFYDESGFRPRALRYNRINTAFNSAWKKAGLSHKYYGSHILRFASATLTRKITGSLDAAASVTGHQSAMINHYAKPDSIELNRKSVIEMENFMNGLSSKENAKPLAASERKKVA